VASRLLRLLTRRSCILCSTQTHGPIHLIQRGPDESGCGKTPCLDCPCFAPRILDLSQLALTLVLLDGRYGAVFTGEIYNYVICGLS